MATDLDLDAYFFRLASKIADRRYRLANPVGHIYKIILEQIVKRTSGHKRHADHIDDHLGL